MKWNRRTVQTVVTVFLSIAAALFLIRFTADHDGESITIFGDDSPSASVYQAPTGGEDPETGLAWISEDELPSEAQVTLVLIDHDGPFPYDEDGSVFQNREGILPDQPRGYYHEYTVVTPTESDRGPRRIVTGDDDEFFWTEDHYASFARIDRS